MIRLCEAELAQIDGAIRPSYEPGDVRPGIVHLGFGNFHRSHEASYVHQLMQCGRDLDWGICGVGVLPGDDRMRDVMKKQDNLSTVIIRHPDGNLDPYILGSVCEYLFAPENRGEVIDRMSDPNVRIVSLTVTEGGYLVDPNTDEFDPTRQTVVFDMIIEALRRRREANVVPFTVMSADNLQGNGDIARRSVLGVAEVVDSELAGWIANEVAFPNSMVDRITPATTKDDIEILRERFDIEDQWPVPCEPFTQWIIEDAFPTGRPQLDHVGVLFVRDVQPYELMKLRLLNAGHQAVAYLGIAAGYTYVDEAIADPAIRSFVTDALTSESVPTLGELPGIDVSAYVSSIIERFANPMMRDTLTRIATDGSHRIPTFVLPIIADNLAAQRSITAWSHVVASWIRLWQAVAAGRIPADQVPQDARSQTLLECGRSHDQMCFIDLPEIFGDLSHSQEFRTAVQVGLSS